MALEEPAIIVVSGKGPEMLEEAKEKGALVSFSKPVDPQALLDAIGEATHSSARTVGGEQ